MPYNVHSVNIRRYFGSAEGMEVLQRHIADFSCPRNPNIEHFLKNSAINFTKQDNSVTYLVFSEDALELLGYFSVAVRPLEVPADKVSKTIGRRLERAGRFDRDANVYNAAAYLIAQLGKNYTNGANERISGEDLLGAAWNKLREIQYHAAGSIAFVEAEDIPALLDFYTRNNFRVFGEREGDEGRLIQLVRAIKQ